MSIRWKFNVTDHLNMGGRAYMEDFICNHIERVDGKIIFAIFGIFDGHGGSDAASFVKRNLVNELKRNINFWSNDDSIVIEVIKEVYGTLQNLMWIEREKWPRKAGCKSTAGTTATIAIVRNDKVFIAHVGDSAIVLACHDDRFGLVSDRITKDHKPTDKDERQRIEESGGCLKRTTNIERVVWHRRKKAPGNEIEQIPFLAVARSLGDLWSYDERTNRYHVSPEPDVSVIKLDHSKHRALIIASDGVWNVVDEDTSVSLLSACQNIDSTNTDCSRVNYAETLVNYSLYQWKKGNMRSDNISAIVVTLLPETEHSVNCNNIGNCSHTEETIQSELFNQNLLSSYRIPNQWEILDSIDDFTQYAPITKSSTANDIDLLKMFVFSSENLSRHCVAWKDDVEYWKRLKDAFAINLGITYFPHLISQFDYSPVSFEEQLVSFSWSLVCLQCVNDGYLSKREVNNLIEQPLLTEFWNTFYRRIIGPNLSVTPEQLTQQTEYQMIMKQLLLYRSSKIRRLLGVTNDDDDHHVMYSLKKSQSTNSKVGTAFPCVTLKRSYSFEGSKVTVVSSVSVMSTEFNSGSSTRPMSPIHEAQSQPQLEAVAVNNILQKYILTKKRSVITLSKKLSFSKNVPRFSLLSCKKGHSGIGRKLVKYIPRKKSNSN